jgi:hypothetical protein
MFVAHIIIVGPVAVISHMEIVAGHGTHLGMVSATALHRELTTAITPLMRDLFRT